MRPLALIFMLSACGRFGFGEGDARPDAVPPGFCNTATFSNPAASSLKDDFTGPYTDHWQFIDLLAPCISQIGTELVAVPPTSMPKYCYAFTLSEYHLTCDSIFMKVPEVTSPQLKVQTLVYASPVSGGNWTLLFEAGGFGMGGSLDTIQYANYDAALDVWWRLTEHDGEVIFDTSTDGLSWREKMRTPTVLDLDHVYISIGAGTYDTVPPSAGQARFRCFNSPPPCN